MIKPISAADLGNPIFRLRLHRIDRTVRLIENQLFAAGCQLAVIDQDDVKLIVDFFNLI